MVIQIRPDRFNRCLEQPPPEVIKLPIFVILSIFNDITKHFPIPHTRLSEVRQFISYHPKMQELKHILAEKYIFGNSAAFILTATFEWINDVIGALCSDLYYSGYHYPLNNSLLEYHHESYTIIIRQANMCHAAFT